MGSTSVNDVANFIGGLNASVQSQMMNRNYGIGSGDTSSTSPSFESILNAGVQNTVSADDSVFDAGYKNSEKNPGFTQKKDSDRIAGEDKPDAGKTAGTDKKQDKVSEDRVKKNSVSDKSVQDSDEMSAEDIEKAGEALSAIIAELLERIQNILQISPEEVENMLNQMGMSAEDLLNSEDLSAFALQAMGAEDSLALLTDESKYEQFQNIVDALSDIMNSESDFDGLSAEELRDLLAKMKEDKDAMAGINPSAQNGGSEDKIGNIGAARVNSLDKQNSKDDASNMEQNQQGTNNFAQNIEMPAVVSGSDATSGMSASNAQEIANQILEYMKSNVKADTQTLEMQLHPASLGNIQISLTNKGGDISASFVAQNEQVKAALETQLMQLQQRFEEQGIKVTSIEVSVSTNSFSENLEQQGHREEEQEANRPKRVRRLQLTPDMEIPEALDEEEQLAAQMLVASGGTMDLHA